MARPPTHTLTGLFSALGPLSPSTAPTAPPLYLIVKSEPVNSWGGVSFDKWHQTPAFLPSCRHIVVPSVWSQTMCSDPSRISGHNLHSKWQHPLLHTGFITTRISICEFNVHGCCSILGNFFPNQIGNQPQHYGCSSGKGIFAMWVFQTVWSKVRNKSHEANSENTWKIKPVPVLSVL